MGPRLAFALLSLALLAAEPISGDAVIRAPYAGSKIEITTTSRLAGAIHSVKWNGVEFIDSLDHGRQLQSAFSGDLGQKPFWAEAFNPTEAGSRDDSAGPTSTSKLLYLKAEGNQLETRNQMAYWLKAGQKSGQHLAKNAAPLSDYILAKRVTIGYRDLPNVLDYRVTFTLPKQDKHQLAQFEALTGYMPWQFSQFYAWNPAQPGELKPIDAGPGEQRHPLVFATESGKHAMAIYSLDRPAPTFGRWKFERERVVKWNAVHRVRHPEAVPPGDYSFHLLVPIGTKAEVLATLQKLHALEQPAKP